MPKDGDIVENHLNASYLGDDKYYYENEEDIGYDAYDVEETYEAGKPDVKFQLPG